MPLPATVRGIDYTGDPFEVETVLDSMSPFDLSLRLTRQVEPGASLFVVVWLSRSCAPSVARTGVALRGVVLQAEERPEGWGLAVQLRQHRFLYPDSL